MPLQDSFARFCKAVSRAAGTPWAFAAAAGFVATWALTGPLFGFSELWQLVINTSTTIVTFLMVFVIQNSQNRDAEALQLKLDEIIFALTDADNQMIDIEDLDQASLDELQRRYEAILKRISRKHGKANAPKEKASRERRRAKSRRRRPAK